MIWFTADSHFSHTNIIKYCNRPFSNSQEMDDNLIKNWNSKVKKNDSVYHLGDVGLGNPIRLKHILDELNGTIYLIKGNHEKSAMNKKCIDRFEWVKDYFELNHFDNEDKKMQLMILFHYSLKVWNKKPHGSWQLFGHCMDLNTEVLTRNGWKFRKELNITDEILSLNISTNKLEFNNIIEFVDYPNYYGNVYNPMGKGVDFRVTENHVILDVSQNVKNFNIRKFYAKDLIKNNKHIFIRGGYLNENNYTIINLSDDLIRLLVWIASDGNICNTNLIRIKLTKKRKIIRITKLLDNLNIPYNAYPQKDGSISFNFNLPKELNNFRLKPLDKIFSYCNINIFNVILEEYSHTDGTKYGNNTTYIYTSKKEEVDILQTASIINGYSCHYNSRIGHGFSKKEAYELYITKGIYKYWEKKDNIKSNVTDEYFWCLKVKNETLIIRRNGKVIITGNSHGKLPIDNSLSMDVGVDCTNYYPISYFEIKEKMEQKIINIEELNANK